MPNARFGKGKRTKGARRRCIAEIDQNAGCFTDVAAGWRHFSLYKIAGFNRHVIGYLNAKAVSLSAFSMLKAKSFSCAYD